MATSDAGRTAGMVYRANPDDRLINEHVAAACLGLKVSTLRRWRWARRGPHWIKVGAAIRYSPVDLATFIAAGRQHPNPEAA